MPGPPPFDRAPSADYPCLGVRIAVRSPVPKSVTGVGERMNWHQPESSYGRGLTVAPGSHGIPTTETRREPAINDGSSIHKIPGLRDEADACKQQLSPCRISKE